jgi:two-component system cell cycle sensor histidine kinase/response regulator CckA
MSANPVRVLLVDDDTTLVMIDTRLLQHIGFQVSAFSSASEALDAFTRQPGEFDLVITDMTMPEMTGAALAEALVAVRPDIPIVLVTGYIEQPARDQAALRRFGEILVKPLSTQALAEAARRALAGRTQAR